MRKVSDITVSPQRLPNANSMVGVPVTVPVPAWLRIEMNLVRRPVTHALQPPADQRAGGEHAHVAELPPEVGQRHKAEAMARARLEVRPDDRAQQKEQDRWSPAPDRQHMPRFLRVHAPQPERGP